MLTCWMYSLFTLEFDNGLSDYTSAFLLALPLATWQTERWEQF